MPEKYDAASYKYFDTYPFTRAQANEIYDVLKKNFDSEKIDKFIDELRSCCEGAACVLDQPDHKTYINDRKSMMRILEKSADLLDEIRKGRGIYNISSLKLLDDYNQPGNKPGALAYECQELAVTIGNILTILIRKLRELDDSNEKRIKGRPLADSKGIVAEIAKIWETCFGKKPTNYMGGPFVDVVRIVLDGLNLKYEYPDRKIRAALKR